MTIFVATKNKGKINDFEEIFKIYDDLKICSINDAIEIPDVEETGDTFEENSIKKAVEISKYLNMYVIADDSGLCCEGLNGEPGVYSARYSGENATDESNNKKLIAKLRGVKNRKAEYISAITVASPTGKTITVVGKVKGEIIDVPLGDGGFGYDPHFFYKEYKKTFAQLDISTRNRISHRANAMDKLKKKIYDFLNN